MKKNKKNIGLMLILLYAFILFLLITAGLCFKKASNYFYILALLWAMAMLCLVPITLLRTLPKSLPEKRARVKIVSKGIKSNTYVVEGVPNSFRTPVVRFDFLNGKQKTIQVPQLTLMLLQEGEEGVLTYQERFGLYFFVRFEKQ